MNIASLVPTLLDSFIQSVDDPESDPRALIPLRTTIICKVLINHCHIIVCRLFIISLQALELIGKYKGYVWTYNDLIVSQLWSLMAPTAANCKKPKLIPATVRLVGILGRSAENEALQELRSKMTLILSPHFIEKHKRISLLFSSIFVLFYLPTLTNHSSSFIPGANVCGFNID